MSVTTLPISRLINVSVSLSSPAAQAQNFSSLLILGTSPVIDTFTRARVYNSLAGVAGDFGVSAPEYLAAALWFEQAPQPTSLYVGRWVNAASAGQAIGASLSAAQQALANFTAVVAGGFTVSVDGTVQHVAALDFAGDSNLNGVASTINTALTGATVVWNANYSRFEATSRTTGTASSVSFLSAPTGGGVTDVSALLGLTAASSGAYLAPGLAAEAALVAVALLDSQIGQNFYGVVVLGAADNDYLAISAYVEGAATYHYHGVTTQEASTLVPGDTTSLAYQMQQLKYTRTGLQYSSSNPYAVASLLGRILTVDYTGNNTVITLMYKQEPGIAPENLNSTQIAALEARSCNVFVAYNNNTAIIEPGVSSSGDFVDTVIGSAAFAIAVQTDLYNALYTSTTKIPQTDAGMHILTTTAENTCSGFVANGMLAPGVWNLPGFGSLKQGDVLSKGFYVYAPSIATQSQATRSKRISVPIQIAAKLAGATHTANVSIIVNP